MSRMHPDRRTGQQQRPPRRGETLYRIFWRNPIITGVGILMFFLLLCVVVALVIAGMILPPY